MFPNLSDNPSIVLRNLLFVYSAFYFYFFIFPPQLTFNIIQTFKRVINMSPKSSESFFIWLAGWFAKCTTHVMLLWAAVSLPAGWDSGGSQRCSWIVCHLHLRPRKPWEGPWEYTVLWTSRRPVLGLQVSGKDDSSQELRDVSLASF